MSDKAVPQSEVGPKSEIFKSDSDLTSVLTSSDRGEWPAGWWIAPLVIAGIFLWVEIVAHLAF